MGCPEHKADEDWVTGTAGAREFAEPGDLFSGPETRGQRHRNEYWRFPPHVYSAASWLAAVTPGRPGKTAFRSSSWLVINPSRPHDSLHVLGSCVGYLVAFGPRRLTDSVHQARINPLSGDPSVPGGSRAWLRDLIKGIPDREASRKWTSLTQETATSHRCRCFRCYLLFVVASQLLRDRHSLSALQICSLPFPLKFPRLVCLRGRRRGGADRAVWGFTPARGATVDQAATYWVSSAGDANGNKNGRLEKCSSRTTLPGMMKRNGWEYFNTFPRRQFRIHKAPGTLLACERILFQQ